MSNSRAVYGVAKNGCAFLLKRGCTDEEAKEIANIYHAIAKKSATIVISDSPIEPTKASLRENLLVTFGSRAGYMDSSGIINLPEGSHGEDILADYAVGVVERYMTKCDDISFDEYIETALMEKFGREE